MTEDKNFRILKSSKEYKKVYQHGKSAFYSGIVIYYIFVNDDNIAGFGITVSRKMVNAVKKNRIKRLIKESLRKSDLDDLKGLRAVIAVRKDLATSTLIDICNSINVLINKVKKNFGQTLGIC